MEEKRKEIEETVRRCASRLENITEEQIQSMVDRLVNMKEIKSVVDSLALNIENLFEKEGQKSDFDACMKDILELSNGVYSNIDEIIAQVQRNKALNYTPR